MAAGSSPLAGKLAPEYPEWSGCQSQWRRIPTRVTICCWLKLPTLARHHSNHLHEFFLWQEVLLRNMELISLYQPEEFGKDQKETPPVRPPPRILLSGIHLGWTRLHHQEGLWVKWLAKDHLGTNPITIKPKTAGYVTELFSLVPLPYCSPPRCCFPIKSLALSAHVSPQTIHFWVLDKSPVLGPRRGPPSCNTTTLNIYIFLSLVF